MINLDFHSDNKYFFFFQEKQLFILLYVLAWSCGDPLKAVLNEFRSHDSSSYLEFLIGNHQGTVNCNGYGFIVFDVIYTLRHKPHFEIKALIDLKGATLAKGVNIAYIMQKHSR